MADSERLAAELKAQREAAEEAAERRHNELLDELRAGRDGPRSRAERMAAAKRKMTEGREDPHEIARERRERREAGRHKGRKS